MLREMANWLELKTLFTDYGMEMPNDDGWLQTVVYFMQFMCIALSFTNKKKKKTNEDTSIGLCSVREIIVYTH